MSVEVSFPNLVDIRQPILGDSFGWDGLEPTAAKKSLVFHHSASDVAAEDGFSIAEYHVNHNGWGGIGYHFVITRSDYPGRPGFTNPGPQVQYVGDLGTWRAHVLNQNPGRVGICFVGMSPDAEQLKLGRQLVDFLIAPNNILPSINFYNQVTVHRLVPDQSTSCPGDDYGNWLPYLQGGDFPAYLVPAPAPVPAPDPVPAPEPTPIPVTVVPPEWEQTWSPLRDASGNPTSVTREVLRPDAVAVHVPDGSVIDNSRPNLTVGQTVDIWGYFTSAGITYGRTKYSIDNNLWNGIDTSFFDAPTGQISGSVPVTVVPPDQVQSNVTDTQLQEATVPLQNKPSVLDLLKELIAQLIALVIRKKKN